MMLAASAAPMLRADAPLRVMIVDDAIVVRGLVARWLQEAGGFEIVGTHRTGRLAVEDMERADPDVVILDIEMPDMDGIEALPLILKKKKTCAVVMASTLTRRNAEISMKCLALGALDYIPKPETNRDLSTSQDFRREIVDKVRHLGQRARHNRFDADARRKPTRAELATAPAPDKAGFRATQTAPAGGGFIARQRIEERLKVAEAPPARGYKLRPFGAGVPRVLAVGSSTGGPQALNALLGDILPLIDRVPVLITQHMPPTFTTILAEHLGRLTGKPAGEAVDGEAIRAGHIYVAPGGRHMSVRRGGDLGQLHLDDGPPVNFCKPAVDPMFRSAAQVYGNAVAAVVLTGMGSDGAVGAGDVVAAGGTVMAQDEASSVVWGMPGATAMAGHCSAVLPLRDLGPRLVRLFAGDRS